MHIVEGIEVKGYGDQGLAEDLAHYCQVSTQTRDHLRAAHLAGAKIETQRSGNICHAEGSVVKVSMDSCLSETTGMTSRPYLTESVLFELQNVLNAGRYAALKTDAKAGRSSILQFGLGMCRVEFESTEKIVQILTQIKSADLPISPWGEKQIVGASQGETHFANQPHDPNGSNELRLPSKLLYAYEYLNHDVKRVGNVSVHVMRKMATFKKGLQSMPKLEWSKLKQHWGRQYQSKTPAQFLIGYIDALLKLDTEAGWTVTWEGGTKADWTQCADEFVRTVPALQHDPRLAEDLKRQIMAVRFG